MTQKLWMLPLACLALAGSAQAAPQCLLTAHVATMNYPGAAAIPPSNNLLLPEGKSVPVEGQKVILYGRVLDKNCLPVREAVVELWQTDPFGKWYLAEGEDLVTARPVFAGAGRAVTDANGLFSFTTAFPGARTKQTGKKTIVNAPQFNLRIKATGFADFKTSLFFENDRRNAEDPVYSKLSAADRRGVTLMMEQAPNNDLNARIDLVLSGHAPYQTY